jgi:hypothetical protein
MIAGSSAGSAISAPAIVVESRLNESSRRD